MCIRDSSESAENGSSESEESCSSESEESHSSRNEQSKGEVNQAMPTRGRKVLAAICFCYDKHQVLPVYMHTKDT